MSINFNNTEEFRLREVWSVHEFARHHRLTKMEESRLKMLHGPFAEMRELMASRQNSVSVW